MLAIWIIGEEMNLVSRINKGVLLGGSGGGKCTPAFLPSTGNSYIRRKKLYMLFIFPEIPRLMHPCYLGLMGAPENQVISLI